MAYDDDETCDEDDPDSWEVIDEEVDQFDAFAVGISNPLLPGPDLEPITMYTIQHVGTGEIRRIAARGLKRLGEKISNGDFYD